MVTAQRTEEDAVDATQDGLTREEVKHKDQISDRVYSLMNNVGASVYVYSPFAKNDKLVLRAKAMDELRYGGNMKDDLFLNPFSAGTENIRTNRISTDLAYTLPIGAHSELNLAMATYTINVMQPTIPSYLTIEKLPPMQLTLTVLIPM